MIFKNFKIAHNYYKYPSSYRFGTIGDNLGVIRSYSNGKNNDIIEKNKIKYKIKNKKIRDLFRLSKLNNKKLRFFYKVDNGVKDLGLFKVKRFYKEYVILYK